MRPGSRSASSCASWTNNECPAREEIAPLCRSRSSIPDAWVKRAAVVTRVEKPSPVQPVHAGGRQCSPSSEVLQNFTTGESARLGKGGTESSLQGGRGPDCANA